MHAAVDCEGARDRELATASSLGAFEWLFACVRAHVLRHDVGFAEALLAHIALIGLVTWEMTARRRS